MSQHSCATPAELLDDKYKSDEFRLYCFKVLPCSQKKHHDWTKCPFAHGGERAKRRSLRTHIYDCEMCPAITKGEECNLGAGCPHSHNAFESWLHPQKYRTLLCKDSHKCDKYVCFFAHGVEELRVPSNPHTTLPLLTEVQAAAGISRSTSSDTVVSSLKTAANPAGGGSPGYALSSNRYSTPVEAVGRVCGPQTGSPSIQTVALLIEQVQEARRMAHESREAAAQAEMQLRLMTEAMLSRTNAEPHLQGGVISPGTQLMPSFTVIDGAESTIFSQPLAVAAAGQQLSSSGNTYVSVAAPTSVSAPVLTSQLSWGASCLPLSSSSPMLGSLSSLIPALATPCTAAIVGPDMPAGPYGTSPGLVSHMSGAFDVHSTALAAPTTSQSLAAPLCVLLSQPQQQMLPQPQQMLYPAANGDVLKQVAYGEISQGSPCSSSTLYYF